MSEQITGLAQELDPLVRRLLAPNPSPFTYTGTQTYIVGRGEVAVIDPGPDLPEHIDAILAATVGEQITAIMCTHTHRDHSPGSRPLALATGAPIVGCMALTLDDDGPRADAAFDTDYRPDRVLDHGDTISGPGWTLEAVATPGHTSNHLCFGLRENKALFSGDHIMGWSTTVVAPPDGDMADYMRSLDLLLARDDVIYHPAHGEAVTDPRRFVAGIAGHRKMREGQIVRLIGGTPQPIPSLVEQMYRGLDPRLRGAAGRSVLAQLLDLEARGQVVRAGEDWAVAG